MINEKILKPVFIITIVVVVMVGIGIPNAFAKIRIIS
jgi:hypothetical protein